METDTNPILPAKKPDAYYYKALVNTPFHVEGQPVTFEVLPGNSGLLATSDPKLIAGLDAAAKAKKGGVVKINEDRYWAEKKTPRSNNSGRKSRGFGPPVRPVKSPTPIGQSVSQRNAVVANPAGQPKAMPRTAGVPGRLSQTVKPAFDPAKLEIKPTLRRRSEMRPDPGQAETNVQIAAALPGAPSSK